MTKVSDQLKARLELRRSNAAQPHRNRKREMKRPVQGQPQELEEGHLMDPNQTLEDIRLTLVDLERFGPCRDMVANLMDKVTALDEWLSNGGFLPRDWQR
ncbi:hypothetical protein SEA_PAINTERBOY_84 [Mycobacterium phage PainterBoy]|nr:hypothetical protein SEA_PAINTERBOY_84 [Mycobacterium phage PainterBoy]